MRRQLNALAAVSPGKRSPLIIDLRYTTGGDLLEAAAAADLLLPEARRIYAIRSVVDGTADWIKATAQQLQGFNASQTVLLLGPETASAAEVFARALIAAGAVSIGLPTVGKCIGQEVIPLAENWTLLLSTVQILDPDGLYCDGERIKPNHILDAEQENLDDTRLLLARIAPDYPALQMALERAGLKKGREARASRISGIVPPTILSSLRPPVQDELSPGPTGSSAPPPSSKDPVRHPVSYVCRRELLSGDRASAGRLSQEIKILYGPFNAEFYLFPDGQLCLGPYKTRPEADKDLVRLIDSGEKGFELVRRTVGVSNKHSCPRGPRVECRLR